MPKLHYKDHPPIAFPLISILLLHSRIPYELTRVVISRVAIHGANRVGVTALIKQQKVKNRPTRTLTRVVQSGASLAMPEGQTSSRGVRARQPRAPPEDKLVARRCKVPSSPIPCCFFLARAVRNSRARAISARGRHLSAYTRRARRRDDLHVFMHEAPRQPI